MESENTTGTETVTTSEAETGTTETLVPIEEATNEELDAIIEQGSKAQPEEAPIQPEQVAPPQQEPTEEEPEQELPKAEPAKPVDDQARLQRIERQLAGLEDIVKRRTSEIGGLKHQIRQFVENERKGLQETFEENPAAGAEKLMRVREAEAQLENLNKQEELITTQADNQRVVMQKVNFDHVSLDDITREFEEDGADPEFLQTFRANPWLTPAPLVVHAAKAAFNRKLVVSLYKTLQAKDQEIAKLKKQPGQVLNKVQQTARNFGDITGKGGRTANPGKLIDKPTHEMSDAELDAFLKQRASR